MDVFGVVYLIETAQQFWSELEEILHIPPDCTLSQLDSTLRSFISICASYHEQYLQSPLQLDHSCDLLMSSELFTFHSERMCEILLEDTRKSTDPHCQLMLYSILLAYGRRHPNFLRSHKRWQPLIPLLMDNVRLEVDPDIDDTFIGGSASGSNTGTSRGIAVPIEAKLRSLSVRFLYEVCRVQKLSLHDLRIFDDRFIEYLFDLVEQTRDQPDESFNYAVIKFIVALNEQFMVASLHPETPLPDSKFPRDLQESRRPETENRVLRILMSRLGSSMTFGENMIFMLNRANRTPEDLVMQLLVLKILYLLFTTKGTSEYFYTNDLCVLVDVFLREIVNLDEDNESLRHTYLRVLHPLLTKTQLRSMPYKRPQIVRVLESLIENENIRDVNPTTKRLVQRCLSGDWCVQFQKDGLGTKGDFERRVDSPGLDAVSVVSAPQPSSSRTLLMPTIRVEEKSSGKTKALKTSRSVENLKTKVHKHRSAPPTDSAFRQAINDSSTSLPRVANAAMPSPTSPTAPNTNGRRRDRAGSANPNGQSASSHDRRGRMLNDTVPYTQEPMALSYESNAPTRPDIRIVPASSSSIDLTDLSAALPPKGHIMTTRRAAPAPPPKRRKPPAVPMRNGSPLSSIASSASQPVLSTGYDLG